MVNRIFNLRPTQTFSNDFEIIIILRKRTSPGLSNDQQGREVLSSLVRGIRSGTNPYLRKDTPLGNSTWNRAAQTGENENVIRLFNPFSNF